MKHTDNYYTPEEMGAANLVWLCVGGVVGVITTLTTQFVIAWSLGWF